MLTQSDLLAIEKIIVKRVSPLEKGVQTLQSTMGTMQSDIKTLRTDVTTLQSNVTTMQKDIKTIKRKVTKNGKTLDVLIVRSDREETHLHTRVKRIEDHLGLTPVTS